MKFPMKPESYCCALRTYELYYDYFFSIGNDDIFVVSKKAPYWTNVKTYDSEFDFGDDEIAGLGWFSISRIIVISTDEL